MLSKDLLQALTAAAALAGIYAAYMTWKNYRPALPYRRDPYTGKYTDGMGKALPDEAAAFSPLDIFGTDRGE